ncbi:DUF6538 domain-containing protein [Methylobacterium sp. CM6241]
MGTIRFSLRTRDPSEAKARQRAAAAAVQRSWAPFAPLAPPRSTISRLQVWPKTSIGLGLIVAEIEPSSSFTKAEANGRRSNRNS